MEGLNLIAHNDLKNPATEAYRVIRTSIQFAQAGKELKTLAVTSCIPNEGKSMTAANLAVVLTQARACCFWIAICVTRLCTRILAFPISWGFPAA